MPVVFYEVRTYMDAELMMNHSWILFTKLYYGDSVPQLALSPGSTQLFNIEKPGNNIIKAIPQLNHTI